MKGRSSLEGKTTPNQMVGLSHCVSMPIYVSLKPANGSHVGMLSKRGQEGRKPLKPMFIKKREGIGKSDDAVRFSSRFWLQNMCRTSSKLWEIWGLEPEPQV